MNVSGPTRKIGYKGDARLPYARAGWQDALHGYPFDYSLIDAAPSPAMAHAYESARLRVLILKMSGLPVPKWNSPNGVPPKVREAIARANALNGEARLNGAIMRPIGKAGWQPSA